MRLGKVKERFFGFWLRFGSVIPMLRDFSNLLLRQRPMIGTTRQNSKILAPAGLQFFLKRSSPEKRPYPELH